MQIATDYEIDFIPHSMNRWVGQTSCESLWNAVFHRHFPWHFFDRIRDVGFSYPSMQREAERRTEWLVPITQVLCQHEHTTAFVETTTNPAVVRFLLKQDKMPLRVVLARDGRGTVCSLMKWYSHSLQVAVARWNRIVPLATQIH